MSTARLSALPAHVQSRIRSCGAPVRVARESRTVEWRTYKCEHRACDYCQRRYALHVTQKITEVIRADDRPVYMVTLTQRPRTPGLSRQSGRICERSISAHWRRTITKARRVAECNRKVPEWKAKGTVKGKDWTQHWVNERAAERTDIRSAVPSEYRRARPAEYDGDVDYLWQKECERAAPDDSRYDEGHYHWHFHVVVPDRALAELIQACWQHTRYQNSYCETDISETNAEDYESADCAAEAAAKELGMYLAGTRSGAFLGSAPASDIQAFFAQLRDVCLYAAGGKWRPIGVTPEPSDDPCIGIAWGDSGVWHGFSEWWEKGARELASAASDGRYTVDSDKADIQPRSVDRRAREILEQVRNFFEDRSGSRTAGGRLEVKDLPTDGLSYPVFPETGPG